MALGLDFRGGGRSAESLKRNRLRKKVILSYLAPLKQRIASKCAFSVAEAMITLLIVSVALAAAAPIMSRAAKQSITNINNESKWQDALGANNITRAVGNVGIGLNPAFEPKARLHVNGLIQADKLHINGAMTVKEDHNEIEVNIPLNINNGHSMHIHAPAGSSAEVFAVTRGADKDRDLKTTAWINADGNSSFAPSGMIAPFDLEECPGAWEYYNVTCKIGGKACIYCKKK